MTHTVRWLMAIVKFGYVKQTGCSLVSLVWTHVFVRVVENSCWLY
ncbi:hypothetical protein AHF37_12817 [Paragonimus kellicotti]|nr:hypothetical protein AHF37_12817 [Paragonimus kellicotti]